MVQYQIGVVTIIYYRWLRKIFPMLLSKKSKTSIRYFINYYEDGSKEYIELQNVNQQEILVVIWLHLYWYNKIAQTMNC